LTHIANVTTDLIVAALVLGFLIFVHELGHFLAAKHFGVRAPVFSIGFGKRLWGFKRGGTDYRISLLPVGGYVRMAGEDPTESKHDDPGNLLAHPRWQRFFISFAGPAVNLVLALIVLAALYKFHYESPAYEQQAARIGDIDPGSPAAAAGLHAGDLIVRMGNQQRPDWEHVEIGILTTTNQAIPLRVLRHGKLLNVSLTPKPEGADQTGYAGLYPCFPSLVGEVEPGSPAARAGIEPGDRILAIDGKKVPCWEQMSSVIQARAGKPVRLTMSRHGKDFQALLQPVRQNIDGQSRWIVGVTVGTDVVVKQFPVGRAIELSLKKNVDNTVLTYVVLKKILTRHMSTRAIAGPVGIVQFSGEAYRLGFGDLVAFVAYISLELGIVNLLPIPIMDGGMIVLLFIEGVMQRDLSVQVKEKIIQAGMLLILLLFVFVTYNDVIRAIGHY
jgi:regulator of sigma E protease